MVLAILIMSADHVYGQVSLGSAAEITKLETPTTVAVGQPLTISVTASYKLGSQFEWLLIAIQDSLPEDEPANAFPTIANSCPPIDRSWDQSICLYHASVGPGDFTVTFTLTAPDHPTMWDLYAAAAVVVMDQKSRQFLQLEKGDLWNFQVNVTASGIASEIQYKTSSKVIFTISNSASSTVNQISQSAMLAQPTSNLGQLGLLTIIVAIAGSLLLTRRRRCL